MDEQSKGNLLDWLDRRKAWQFLAILYMARWVALAPILALTPFLFTRGRVSAATVPEQWSEFTPLGLLLGVVIVPPLLETLLECSLPYWIVSWARDYRRRRPKRCWGFVAISACLMGVLHPIPGAIIPALVTGVFLAYCYVRFAATSIWQAILATWAFHAAINLVGWTLLVMF